MHRQRSAPACRRHRLRGARGFTLVELVMVIVLLGVLSIVALPRFSATSSVSSAVFRDEVVSALRYARTTAISHRRLVCVSLNANAVTLSIASVNPATSCTSNLPGPDGNSAFVSSGSSMITTAGTVIHFHPAGTVGPASGGIGDVTVGIQSEPDITVVGGTGHVD